MAVAFGSKTWNLLTTVFVEVRNFTKWQAAWRFYCSSFFPDCWHYLWWENWEISSDGSSLLSVSWELVCLCLCQLLLCDIFSDPDELYQSRRVEPMTGYQILLKLLFLKQVCAECLHIGKKLNRKIFHIIFFSIFCILFPFQSTRATVALTALLKKLHLYDLVCKLRMTLDKWVELAVFFSWSISWCHLSRAWYSLQVFKGILAWNFRLLLSLWIAADLLIAIQRINSSRAQWIITFSFNPFDACHSWYFCPLCARSIYEVLQMSV